MKQLNNYILEKFKIKKGINPSLLSEDGKKLVSIFSNIDKGTEGIFTEYILKNDVSLFTIYFPSSVQQENFEKQVNYNKNTFIKSNLQSTLNSSFNKLKEFLFGEDWYHEMKNKKIYENTDIPFYIYYDQEKCPTGMLIETNTYLAIIAKK